jgi:hypothetical protein
MAPRAALVIGGAAVGQQVGVGAQEQVGGAGRGD